MSQMLRQCLLISLLLIFSFSRCFSQTSSVQVIPTVMPPYSTLLSEYYSGDMPRLSVMLLNKDFNQPFLQVSLRMSIEGQGIKMQSSLYGNYPTIDLSPGAPVTVSQADLAPYFNAQNLQVASGISGGVKPQTRLPEGFYQFCFEAIEKNTGRVVGSKQCAQAYLTLSDPPFLTMPEKGKALTNSNPFNLLFQWTPRHMANPNSYNTEYEFSLVEIWDEGIAPEAAFYTAQPIYTTKLTTPNLFYGPGEPQLLTGKKYAWRVKATMTGSTGEQEPFRNEGYSEIFWFRVQSDCPLIQRAQITINPKTNKADFNWAADPMQLGSYHFDYRKKGDSKWSSLETPTNKTSLSGLKWDTDYEYKIGCRCVITDDFMYGSNQSFRTLKQDTASCSPSAPANITNRAPIASLKQNDTIYASGFRMRLTKVSGGNGQFTGEGYLALMVPTTTTEVSVRARFSDILVNTDKQMYSGKIVSIYDATEGAVTNASNFTEGGLNTGEVKTGGTSITAQVNKTIDPTTMATVTYKVNNDGDTTYSITVKATNGKPVTVQSKKMPATVQDKDGNLYAIDKMGNVTKVGSQGTSQGQLLANKGPDELNKLQTAKGTVTFERHLEQQYAFDAYDKVYEKSILFSGEYESLNEGKYRVANKLLTSNSTDKVIAKVSNLAKDINADSIRFVTGKGVEFNAKKIGADTYEVILLSGPSNDAQELYAVYRDNKAVKANKDVNVNNQNFTYSLGKLKIATYEPKEVKVVLVPVGGMDINASVIEEGLHEIYKKYGVTVQIEKAASYEDFSWDLNKDGKLNIKGSSWLSNQTEEMKSLNRAYASFREGIIDKDAVYLFLLKQSDDIDILGDMPIGKQFGYIFEQPTEMYAVTMGHEIGHGIFRMEHTFSERHRFSNEDLKDNLLNYHKGTNLVKLQWDAIHAPALIVGFTDDDDNLVKNLNDANIEVLVTAIDINGARVLKADEVAFISSEPEMPQINIRINDKSNVYKSVMLKMIVEYSRSVTSGPAMSQMTLFPEKGKVQSIVPNGQQVWKLNWQEQFIGGTVWLKVLDEKSEKLLKIFKFHIRGKNPTMKEVKNYIAEMGYDNEYWFFSRMIRHESGSGDFDLSPGKQFNEPIKEGVYTATNFAGLPVWGTPNGWGISQLDNKDEINAKMLELWNWKKNIDKGKLVIDQKKLYTKADIKTQIKNIEKIHENDPDNIQSANDEREGPITFSHITTNFTGFSFVKGYFNEPENGVSSKSFIEAHIIRRYNGGLYYKAKVNIKEQTAQWYISKGPNSYVEEICNENE